jgi:hypothetical protein
LIAWRPSQKRKNVIIGNVRTLLAVMGTVEATEATATVAKMQMMAMTKGTATPTAEAQSHRQSSH